MPPDRREFIRLAGASAGSILLAACSDAVVQSLPTTSSLSSAQDGTTATSSSAVSTPVTTATPSPSIASLQSFLQQNASSTFEMPAIATAIPDIAWAGLLSGSASVATSLPTGEIFPASSPLINGPLRSQYADTLPGNPMVLSYPCLAVNRAYTCKGTPRTVGSPTVVRFMTDAPVLELAGAVGDGSPQGVVTTLIVDDQLVPPKVLSTGRLNGGGWDVGAIRIDFGSRAIRDIWVQTDMYLAYLKIGQYDTLFSVDDQTEPQITVIGDSYLQRQSANFGGGAIALEVGARLGIRNVAIDGIGGTGYWNSGGNVGNLNDRLPADVVDDSTIYLVMAGLNDYGDYTNPPPQIVWPLAATFVQAVTGYMQNLRAALPNAVLVVTAPFCPVPPMSDSSYVANAATNDSGTGDFLYMANLHKTALQQIAGPWVYIDVLMGGGWLNSSGATGDISNLQWFTGGTPAPGTTATYKPGNTTGGGGGGFGGIATIPVVGGGQYQQAPDITASGGSGSGLLLASSIDSTGVLTSINVVSPGSGYTSGSGLPTISIDATYQVAPATLGGPVLMVGINPNGGYPLPSFAPPGVPGDLNNIYVMLLTDLTHPSPDGVEYLSTRLAQNIYQAVMAL
jgi:lysophospholipase L1-like esterase